MATPCAAHGAGRHAEGREWPRHAPRREPQPQQEGRQAGGAARAEVEGREKDPCSQKRGRAVIVWCGLCRVSCEHTNSLALRLLRRRTSRNWRLRSEHRVRGGSAGAAAAWERSQRHVCSAARPSLLPALDRECGWLWCTRAARAGRAASGTSVRRDGPRGREAREPEARASGRRRWRLKRQHGPEIHLRFWISSLGL